MRICFVLLLVFCVIPIDFIQAQRQPGPLAPIKPSEWDYRKAAHLLDRAGFSGTPKQIEELARLTPRKAVDRLVNYHRVAQDSRLVDFVPQPYVPPKAKKGQNNYQRRLQLFFGRVAFDNRQIESARD